MMDETKRKKLKAAGWEIGSVDDFLGLVVAGTGHRPDKLGGYGQESTQKLAKFAKTVLREIKPKVVISGMALGWDQALAWAAINLDIPLIAAIPFSSQPTAWPEPSQMTYAKLLARADKTCIVSEGLYANWKFQKRNEWMVDNCNLVLALWNGSKGGTGNCIKYAESKDVKILNLWEKWNND